MIRCTECPKTASAASPSGWLLRCTCGVVWSAVVPIDRAPDDYTHLRWRMTGHPDDVGFYRITYAGQTPILTRESGQ